MRDTYWMVRKGGKDILILNDFCDIVFFRKARKLVLVDRRDRTQRRFYLDDKLFGIPVVVLILEAAQRQDIEVTWRA